MADLQKRTVLITGCSAGGIGWAMTKAFQHRGFRVFATVRNPSAAEDLLELENVEILQLDVTDPKTIVKCRDVVSSRTGGTLDVLVNNAGVEAIHPLLEVDISQAKKIYDVNVWGTLAVVQAFSPMVIKANGVISNQSSIDAVLSMAWAGIFSSSKAAVTRISETLRVELEPLGVRVVTSMCGSADTPMFHKPGGQMCLPETSYYYKVQDKAYKERMEHRSKAMKVEVLAEKLVKDILEGSRAMIWHGAFATTVRFATWTGLIWLVNRIVNGERGVNGVKRNEE